MSEPLNRQSSAFALRTWCARMYFLCSLTAAGVLGRVWSVIPQSSNWDEAKVFLSAVWSNTIWSSIVWGMRVQMAPGWGPATLDEMKAAQCEAGDRKLHGALAMGKVLNDAHICRSGTPAGTWICEDPFSASRAA